MSEFWRGFLDGAGITMTHRQTDVTTTSMMALAVALAAGTDPAEELRKLLDYLEMVL